MSGDNQIVIAVLARDCKLALRAGGGWFYGVFFFCVFVALYAVTFGPETAVLRQGAPAIIWLAVAWSLQFTSASLFESDYADGSLKAFAVQTSHLFGYVVGKLGAVLLTTAVPMILMTPVIFIFLGISPKAAVTATVPLLVGIPAVVLLSAFSSAMSTGLRAGGVFAAIIAAPFMMPSLIFGVLSLKTFFLTGLLWSPETFIVAAISLFILATTPWFIVQTLRVSLE